MKAAVLSALAASVAAMPQADDKPHCVGECQSGLGARASVSLLLSRCSLPVLSADSWPRRCGADKNSRMPPIMKRKMAEHAACSALSMLTHEQVSILNQA